VNNVFLAIDADFDGEIEFSEFATLFEESIASQPKQPSPTAAGSPTGSRPLLAIDVPDVASAMPTGATTTVTSTSATPASTQSPVPLVTLAHAEVIANNLAALRTALLLKASQHEHNVTAHEKLHLPQKEVVKILQEIDLSLPLKRVNALVRAHRKRFYGQQVAVDVQALLTDLGTIVDIAVTKAKDSPDSNPAKQPFGHWHDFPVPTQSSVTDFSDMPRWMPHPTPASPLIDKRLPRDGLPPSSILGAGTIELLNGAGPDPPGQTKRSTSPGPRSQKLARAAALSKTSAGGKASPPSGRGSPSTLQPHPPKPDWGAAGPVASALHKMAAPIGKHRNSPPAPQRSSPRPRGGSVVAPPRTAKQSPGVTQWEMDPVSAFSGVKESDT